ncbi:hypothetical protein LRU_00785 [Ligilactobacillus ruminis SPM0211]|uniref:Uncharacterized protein n=1 Tax=Ligilactobacillus ruminis SPM0211 TaxID=1040964 RepID=F7QZD1_9LACO|nr:hypothetical protein LRU_00785 [Ligilactobacillus ruminis SPM0211]
MRRKPTAKTTCNKTTISPSQKPERYLPEKERFTKYTILPPYFLIFL